MIHMIKEERKRQGVQQITREIDTLKKENEEKKEGNGKRMKCMSNEEMNG